MAGEGGLQPGDTTVSAPGSWLTQGQRALARGVCREARTFDGRIRELAKVVWLGGASAQDAAAVYTWLVELDLANRVDCALFAGAA
jgi:hypothetical protein